MVRTDTAKQQIAFCEASAFASKFVIARRAVASVAADTVYFKHARECEL